MNELSLQDQEFVKEVAITGNATQAVKKVYKTESESYARLKGHKNITKYNTQIQEVKRSIAEQIPDSLVVEKHLALLNKEEVVTKNNMTTGEVDVIPTGQIDVQAVSKGLDMVYKLKGAYAPEKSIALNVNADITNPKARELAEKYEAELKKSL